MTQRNDRLEPGQAWTGRSGMGSDIRIKRIDLGTGMVLVERVPTDKKYPTFTIDLNALCASFRPK